MQCQIRCQTYFHTSNGHRQSRLIQRDITRVSLMFKIIRFVSFLNRNAVTDCFKMHGEVLRVYSELKTLLKRNGVARFIRVMQ
jgi:hypothetical protein